MENYTIEKLINDSIEVYDGMIVVWPQNSQKETILNNYDVATFNGSYASNNGTLAFVMDSKTYVTPYTRRALRALSGFKQNYFYVPFSNGDYPKKEKDQWIHLREMQKSLSVEEFTEDCLNYSLRHNIGKIDDRILENCFEIPDSGVPVKHFYYENVVYPFFLTKSFDCIHPSSNIGKFCCNNGRVVFIYRDGRTFVTKGYKIKSVLIEAGYKEAYLLVPFSNGEEIQNLAMKRRWDSIEK